MVHVSSKSANTSAVAPDRELDIWLLLLCHVVFQEILNLCVVLDRFSRRFWLCNKSHLILFLLCCEDEAFLLYPVISLVLSILDGFSKPWAKRRCDRND